MRKLALILLLSITAFGRTMKNGDVVRMARDGASVSDMVAQINTNEPGFSLFPEDVKKLCRKGVPEVVIDAMSVRQTGQRFRLPAAPVGVVPPTTSQAVSSPSIASSKPEESPVRRASVTSSPGSTKQTPEAEAKQAPNVKAVNESAKSRPASPSFSGSGPNKRVHIRGYVTAINSATNFEVEDYRINTDASVTFEVEKSDDSEEPSTFRPEEFRVGDEVDIRGTLDKTTGLLTAENIKVNLDEHRHLKRTALIEAAPKLTWVAGTPNGMIAADGQHIIVDGSTKVFFRQNSSQKRELKSEKSRKDAGLHDDDIQPAVPLTEKQSIAPNTFISYEGFRQADGTVLARKVEFTDNELTSAERRLRKAIHPRVKLPNYATDKSGELRIQGQKFKLLANQSVQQYVQNLGMSLVPQFQRDMSESDVQKIPFRFFVVDVSEPNAAAYPDGTLIIHSSLLKVLENEAQLAAVLSHEIAHAVQEHQYRQLQYHKKALLALEIGGAVGSIYGGRAVADMAKLTDAAIRNGYSRSLENQADRLGMQYMLSAGYDPREAPRVWKVMAMKLGDHATDFFWDRHDNDTTRRSYLMAELRNNYSYLNLTGLTQNSQQFAAVAGLIGQPQLTRHVIRLKQGHQTASLE